jgi:predicted Zn-dependent peptidase
MKYKRKVLPNGMRVITVHMKDTPTVTVLVMVEAGSKYESKEKNGISHFLEHMVFKGTEKRPTAFTISKELDSIGSQYNAFTSEEYTGYYAKAAPKHVSTLLDVVSDLYLNPAFDEKEMQKEKGVIIEEINMYLDLPHRHVQEIFMNLLYGDQPAGWTITGPRENIQAMERKDFVDYRNNNYVAEATTVIVAGNFDEKKVQKEIQQRFASLSKTKKHKKVKTIDVQTEPQVLVESRKTDQAHIVLGVRGFKAGSPQNPTIRMLNAVLGAGMSSRLFQKLREEMGVGYYVRSSYDTYTDHGIFSVSIGADVSRVEEVVNAIIAELKRFTTELVSKEELEKTQEYIIGMMLLGLESSDSIAEFYGYQEIMRQPLKMPNDLIKEIRSVTPEKIRSMAKKLFVSKNLNLAMVGPDVDPEKLKALLKF